MPNQGDKGNRDRDEETTGTSGRQGPGNGAQEWSNEVTPPPATENTRRRNQEDEDSGLGNRNTFR